ncbi:MAG: right-handed parallel beta-helix repeat-containing protein [Solirubrobacterales bacterium]
MPLRFSNARSLAAFCATIAFSLLAVAPGAAKAQTPVQIWVSPNGNDEGVGSKSDPFRTLERARNLVRARLKTRDADMIVNLLDGNYRLKKTFWLDARDSGRAGRSVTYRAAPDAKPRISGAFKAENWTLINGDLNIYRAKVPVGTQTRQLYVNGRRALRARGQSYPNGFVRTTDGFQAPDSTMSTWGNQSDIEAVTLTQWKMMRCPLASISGQQLTMQQPCWNNVNVFPYLWSFQTIVRFENAYELLDSAGEWYLDKTEGWLYYIPRVGEELATADVEVPVVEALISGRGSVTAPISNINFRGISFEYGTWLNPSGPNGYAADQSGFHLNGGGHVANVIGHDPNTARTPGNVRFTLARRINFTGNDFRRLGGVGLDFATGSQNISIIGNRFEDISAAGVQLGGVDTIDHHPTVASQKTKDNKISNNLITRIGLEFQDAPGIFIGFTTRSTVRNNEISYVPWSGIAIGWGWGLLDPGGFLGLPGAVPGQWGNYTTPTASSGNRILSNRIKRFLNVLWDGGAIYTQGQQGATAADGELIAGNVASEKRRLAGGNTFYTDGGSRYVTLENNVSLSNKPGITDFGPCDLTDSLVLCWVMLPYGSDRGGCRPYGDITYIENFWQFPRPYWDACPYEGHPVNVVDQNNTVVTGPSAISQQLLAKAGRQGRYKRHVGAQQLKKERPRRAPLH